VPDTVIGGWRERQKAESVSKGSWAHNTVGSLKAGGGDVASPTPALRKKGYKKHWASKTQLRSQTFLVTANCPPSPASKFFLPQIKVS
jgi:hypothetical protein